MEERGKIIIVNGAPGLAFGTSLAVTCIQVLKFLYLLYNCNFYLSIYFLF